MRATRGWLDRVLEVFGLLRYRLTGQSFQVALANWSSRNSTPEALWLQVRDEWAERISQPETPDIVGVPSPFGTINATSMRRGAELIAGRNFPCQNHFLWLR